MGFLEGAWGILAALLPTIGLLYLFWVVMKHILEGDRRERAASRQWEAEQDRLAQEQSTAREGETEKNPE